MRRIYRFYKINIVLEQEKPATSAAFSAVFCSEIFSDIARMF